MSLDCLSTVDKGSLAFAADDPNGIGDLHDRVLAEGGLMLAVEDVTFAFRNSKGIRYRNSLWLTRERKSRKKKGPVNTYKLSFDT